MAPYMYMIVYVQEIIILYYDTRIFFDNIGVYIYMYVCSCVHMYGWDVYRGYICIWLWLCFYAHIGDDLGMFNDKKIQTIGVWGPHFWPYKEIHDVINQWGELSKLFRLI